MPNLFERRQRGYTLLTVTALFICLLLGVVLFRKHRAVQPAQLEPVTQEQPQAAEVRRKEQERKALEERQAAAQREHDVLATSYKALDQATAKWDDAVRVAGATGRIALAGPVSNLQVIHRETEQIAVAPCMDQAKAALVKSMASTVEGFVIFMRDDMKLGEVLSSPHFEEARQAREAYAQGRAQCPQ